MVLPCYFAQGARYAVELYPAALAAEAPWKELLEKYSGYKDAERFLRTLLRPALTTTHRTWASMRGGCGAATTLGSSSTRNERQLNSLPRREKTAGDRLSIRTT